MASAAIATRNRPPHWSMVREEWRERLVVKSVTPLRSLLYTVAAYSILHQPSVQLLRFHVM